MLKIQHIIGIIFVLSSLICAYSSNDSNYYARIDLTYTSFNITGNYQGSGSLNYISGESQTLENLRFGVLGLDSSPEITLFRPYDGDHFNYLGDESNFSWTFVDYEDNLKLFQFQLDNVSDNFTSPEINITTTIPEYNVSLGLLADGNYSWRVRGRDEFGLRQWSDNFTFIIDTINPNIAWTTPANDNTTNVTGSITTDIDITDLNIFKGEMNVTNSLGELIYSNLTINLTGTSFTFTDVIDLSSNITGYYDYTVTATDSHTLENWNPDVEIKANTSSKEFIFDKDVVKISVKSSDLNTFTYSKEQDRYTFDMDFDSNKPFDMIIEADEILEVPNSKYKGHIILDGKYWFDTEPYNAVITHKGKGYVVLRVTPDVQQIKMKSLGGLNTIKESRRFYLDNDGPNITSTYILPDTLNNLSSQNITVTVDDDTEVSSVWVDIFDTFGTFIERIFASLIDIIDFIWQFEIPLTDYGNGTYNATIQANDTLGNLAINRSETFDVDLEGPNCELVSITPSDIEANSTGTFEMIVNCTDPAGINVTKIGDSYRSFFTMTVDDDGSLPNQWSIFYPENNLAVNNTIIEENILRAIGRNESGWYEDLNIKEIQDDIYSYAIYDGRYGFFKIEENTSTTVLFNISGPIEPLVFKSAFPLSKQYMFAESKKEYHINKSDGILMTLESLERRKGSDNYTIVVYANAFYDSGPNKNVDIYICNSSYKDITCSGSFTGGCSLTPETDANNCLQVDSLDTVDLDTREFTQNNSDYYKTTFGVNNGKIGNIFITNQTYIYLRSLSTSGSFTMRYANGDSRTDVSFADSGLAFVSSDDGLNYETLQGTPDIFANSIKSGDQFQIGGCVWDSLGNPYCNFTFVKDDIGDVNFDINSPSIRAYQQGIHLYGDETNKNEDLNGTYRENMTIHVNIASDPDEAGTVNHSLYLYNQTGEEAYIINGSFYSPDDSDVHIFFDTKNVPDGNYRMNVTAIADDNPFDINDYLTLENFTIDNTGPTIVNVTDEIDPEIIDGEHYINITVDDINATSLWIDIFDSVGNLIERVYGTILDTVNGVWEAIINLIDGNYYSGEYNYTAQANDSVGNVNDFNVTDVFFITQAQNVTDLSANPSTVELFESANLSAIISQNWIDSVFFEITQPNGSLHTFRPGNSSDNYTLDFNVTNEIGSYTFHIVANNTQNQINNTENITFTVQDTNSPIVNLRSPANNSLYDLTKNINFVYNVTDFGLVDNCTLLINGVPNGTVDTSITKDTNQSFTRTLFGTYLWNVECTDESNNKANGSERNVSITFVGNAPTFEAISDFSKDEEFSVFTLDLSDNISDTEDGDNELNFTYITNRTGDLTISIDNSTDIATFTSVANITGAIKVNLTVWDTDGLSNQTSFDLIINNINDNPWSNTSLSNVTLLEDFATTQVIEVADLNANFSDVEDDGNPSSYSLISSTNTSSTCYFDASNNFDCDSLSDLSSTDYYTIELNDSSLESVRYNFQITINAVNDIPSNTSLLTPVNNTISNDYRPTFTWGTATDKESNTINYNLLIYKEKNMTNNVVNITQTGTSYLSTLLGGTYYWTVNTSDTEGYNSTDMFNLTILNDSTAPILDLSSPANNSIETSLSVTFNYIVTDNNNITNCSLYINDSYYDEDFTISNGSNSFSKTFIEQTNYNWSVNCQDEDGNLNESFTRFFTISIPIIPPSTGGGGGGGFTCGVNETLLPNGSCMRIEEPKTNATEAIEDFIKEIIPAEIEKEANEEGVNVVDYVFNSIAKIRIIVLVFACLLFILGYDFKRKRFRIIFWLGIPVLLFGLLDKILLYNPETSGYILSKIGAMGTIIDLLSSFIGLLYNATDFVTTFLVGIPLNLYFSLVGVLFFLLSYKASRKKKIRNITIGTSIIIISNLAILRLQNVLGSAINFVLNLLVKIPLNIYLSIIGVLFFLLSYKASRKKKIRNITIGTSIIIVSNLFIFTFPENMVNTVKTNLSLIPLMFYISLIGVIFLLLSYKTNDKKKSLNITIGSIIIILSQIIWFSTKVTSSGTIGSVSLNSISAVLIGLAIGFVIWFKLIELGKVKQQKINF